MTKQLLAVKGNVFSRIDWLFVVCLSLGMGLTFPYSDGQKLDLANARRHFSPKNADFKFHGRVFGQ
jgi:hypothetical protein